MVVRENVRARGSKDKENKRNRGRGKDIRSNARKWKKIIGRRKKKRGKCSKGWGEREERVRGEEHEQDDER